MLGEWSCEAMFFLADHSKTKQKGARCFRNNPRRICDDLQDGLCDKEGYFARLKGMVLPVKWATTPAPKKNQQKKNPLVIAGILSTSANHHISYTRHRYADRKEHCPSWLVRAKKLACLNGWVSVLGHNHNASKSFRRPTYAATQVLLQLQDTFFFLLWGHHSCQSRLKQRCQTQIKTNNTSVNIFLWQPENSTACHIDFHAVKES